MRQIAEPRTSAATPHAVRHHRQPLAPVQEHGADQRLESVLEYMFSGRFGLQPSSLNLMKFVGPDGQFDVEAFRHVGGSLIVAQEIIVDNAATRPRRSARLAQLRPLGLGFANLGALLMSMGCLRQRPGPRPRAASPP